MALQTSLSILIVDDDEGVCESVSKTLSQLGHTVRSAHSLKEAREARDRGIPDAVFLDLRLPDGNGIEFLQELKRDHPHVEVIMITGYPDVDMAVRSMRLGAVDLIEKPFTKEQIASVVNGFMGSLPAVERQGGSSKVPQMIGDSPVLLAVCQEIQLVAATPNTTAMIQGESGTGKEVAARAIHSCSSRAKGPFVAINCAALTETLLEAELFGYDKGAFTGAVSEGKPGLFEVADKGTIFLDEIGEMDMALQAKLLRVLQERVVKRVGGLSERPIDVRVVASTNRNLKQAVATKQFREDLYYRLNVMPLCMPPLRARGDDISLLAHHFLKTLTRELGKTEIKGFSRPALNRMLCYSWPGNVRELRNVVERAVIVARSSRIELEDIMLSGKEDDAEDPGEGILLRLANHQISTAERALIELALSETGGQKTRAAELLGINRATLYNKLRSYGIE